MSLPLAASLPLPLPQPAGGKPLVVADPACATSATFMDLGAAVVREVAKISGRPNRQAVYYDPAQVGRRARRVCVGCVGVCVVRFTMFFFRCPQRHLCGYSTPQRLP